MVVRFDLERDRGAVAEVEDSRVLARPLEHALARRGEPLQERGGVFVAAVLRPEEGEDRELEMVRVSPEQLPDTARFPVGQTKGAVKGLGGDLRQVIQCNRGIGKPPRERSTGRLDALCGALRRPRSRE
jgi:hypothetical protein